MPLSPDWNTSDLQHVLLESDQIRVSLTNRGAALVSLEIPDCDGVWQDVIIGGKTPQSFLENPSYFGATVGRYANRIGKGRFTLDGTEYQLAVNNGPNHLHGGPTGFSYRTWAMTELANGVSFEFVSPDGDEGYPGELRTGVTYRVDGNRLVLDYVATTDAPTILNLTNHTYWNLSGSSARTILDHQLTLFTDRYLENDADVLPTGQILNVSGTPYDFRTPQTIGQEIDRTNGGYDNCFVIRRDDSGDSSLTPAASVFHPNSGRTLRVLTTEPGVQLYTANHFDGSLASAGADRHAAFCLECQHFPDAPNQPEFPGVVLRPGERYTQQTVYEFRID